MCLFHLCLCRTAKPFGATVLRKTSHNRGGNGGSNSTNDKPAFGPNMLKKTNRNRGNKDTNGNATSSTAESGNLFKVKLKKTKGYVVSALSGTVACGCCDVLVVKGDGQSEGGPTCFFVLRSAVPSSNCVHRIAYVQVSKC